MNNAGVNRPHSYCQLTCSDLLLALIDSLKQRVNGFILEQGTSNSELPPHGFV